MPIPSQNFSRLFQGRLDSAEVSSAWVVSNNKIIYKGLKLTSADTVTAKMRADGKLEIDNKYVDGAVSTIVLSDDNLVDTNVTLSGKAGIGLGSSTKPLTIELGSTKLQTLTSVFLTKGKEDNVIIKNVSDSHVGDVTVSGLLEYGGSDRSSDQIKGTFTLNDSLEVFSSSISMYDESTLSIRSSGNGSKLSGKLDGLNISGLYVDGGLFFDISNLDSTGINSLTISGDMNLALLDTQLSEITKISSANSGTKIISIYKDYMNLSSDITFSNNNFDFGEFSGSLETASKTRFTITGDNTSVDLGKTTISTLSTINFGSETSQDDDERQSITLNGNSLKNVTTINADSENDTIYLSESVGQTGLSYVIGFTSNENGILQLATTGEAGSINHNYVRIGDNVHTKMHIKAGDNGDRLQGGVGHNVFTLGSGCDTFKSNVKDSADSDIIHAFDGTNDKFIYYGSLQNDGASNVTSSTVVGGEDLASAMTAKADALVYVISTNDENLNTAIDNFIEGKASAADLLDVSRAALGTLSGLDDCINGSESVLLAVNAGDTGGSVIMTLTNSETTTQDTIGQNEVQLVAVFDDTALTTSCFFS